MVCIGGQWEYMFSGKSTTRVFKSADSAETFFEAELMLQKYNDHINNIRPRIIKVYTKENFERE